MLAVCEALDRITRPLVLVTSSFVAARWPQFQRGSVQQRITDLQTPALKCCAHTLHAYIYTGKQNKSR